MVGGTALPKYKKALPWVILSCKLFLNEFLTSTYVYPSCWRLLAGWFLVSSHQFHLVSTHALVDTKQATETSHGKTTPKRNGQ